MVIVRRDAEASSMFSCNATNAVSRTDCALTLKPDAAMTCEADRRDKSEPDSWVQRHEGDSKIGCGLPWSGFGGAD